MVMYRKAVFAFLITGLGSLIAGYANGGGIDGGEWLTAALLSVSSAAGVWAVPNSDPVAPPTTTPSTRRL